MNPKPANAIVFVASAAILVTEIAAGRVMAPYVGVSLETFTGIIGVVLAGIAVGAAMGGKAADQQEPRSLLAPALGLGGVLIWASVPIVNVIGPRFGDGAIAIVVLAALGFFAPAVVLSAVTPIVAKLRLASLEQTGTVFGGLSAAGTVGALVGTFLTGFVLVATVGTRTILFGAGAVLILTAVVVQWLLIRQPPSFTAALLAVVIGASVFALDPACEYETRYACAVVVADADDPSRVALHLDLSRHALVDVDDPTFLGFRYIRLFGSVLNALAAGPLDALHIGGGGFTMPRYLAATRPGSRSHVIEIDSGVVEIAEERLGFVRGPNVTVEVSDARIALDDLPTDGYDVVIGDAFSGKSVPWHLTTVEVVDEIGRVLAPGGLYVVNVIDGETSGFARAEIATLQARFAHVIAILPDASPPRASRNQILVASDQELPALDIDPADGVVLAGDALAEYVGDARVLTDDFAPVEQLAK